MRSSTILRRAVEHLGIAALRPDMFFMQSDHVHHVSGFYWSSYYGYRLGGEWTVGRLLMHKPTLRRSRVCEHLTLRADSPAQIEFFDGGFLRAAEVGRVVPTHCRGADRSGTILQTPEWRGVWTYTVKGGLEEGHWYLPLGEPVGGLTRAVYLMIVESYPEQKRFY